MKKKLILHVPHSSDSIPIRDGFLVDSNALEKEILKLTDWYTDDLFYSDEDEMVIAPFSRIFCDPERFEDDEHEVMSQFGMGVLYEKSDAGEPLRSITKELREKVISEYYRIHHLALTFSVNDQLKRFGKALIIDCHSYPNTPLIRDLDKNPIRPDFNIGTDSFHTPQKLIDLSIAFFAEKGFSLGIDWPYKGSIVPLEHYQKDKRVITIMLEINRALYLKEPTNEKSEKYSDIKKVTGDFLTMMRDELRIDGI
jgi:N-formylglutamate amidohydrolase